MNRDRAGIGVSVRSELDKRVPMGMRPVMAGRWAEPSADPPSSGPEGPENLISVLQIAEGWNPFYEEQTFSFVSPAS